MNVLPFSALNPTAIMLALLAQVAIGFAWYSPMLFGNRWMALLGMDPKHPKKPMQVAFAQAFVGWVIATVAISLTVIVLDPSTMTEALVYGFLLWVGFSGAIDYSRYAWEAQPFELFLINGGNSLVSQLVAIAILFAMR